MRGPRSRDVLAANLRKMIEAEASKGDRPTVRSWALKRGLSVRTVDRLTKAEHAVTLDILDEVAAACGLQAWQLLTQTAAPSGPPDSALLTSEDRALLDRLKRLL